MWYEEDHLAHAKRPKETKTKQKQKTSSDQHCKLTPVLVLNIRIARDIADSKSLERVAIFFLSRYVTLSTLKNYTSQLVLLDRS